jgi:hypothetical protein
MLDTPVNSLKHALRAGGCRSTLTAERAAAADVANHRGTEAQSASIRRRGPA